MRILLAVSILLATPAPAAPSAHDRLFALFQTSDEAMLRRYPQQATARGDLRYADRIGDLYTDALTDADLAADRADLAALARIDRTRLSASDRIAYDVFAFDRRIELRGLADPALRVAGAVRPVNHFYGFHLEFADTESGQGTAPFNTPADYRNGLARRRQFAPTVDRIVAQMREGLALGIVESKLTVTNMIDQLDLQIAAGAATSPYLAPVRTFPDAVPESERTALRTAYQQIFARDMLPALVRLRDFLRDTYLPRARTEIGLHAMKGGDRLYAYLIERNTTLPLTADAVHKLGLSEVARIRGEMAAAAAKAGFKGSLPELFEYMRTAKRFQPASVEQLRDGYAAIKARVEARVGEQFATLPRAPLEIRPTPSYREKTSAGGEYEHGTVDGARPGTFFYNGYDLPSRYTWEMETLFLHEAEPGHHFQISLAQENTALPAFLRYGGNTAYVEGWALYAETLWPELGLESDPWQRLGGLNDEMLRAMRLVVDTGIHAFGWSREQSIKYMLDNSPEAVTDATAEVERYIAIPGQALAYKIGQLTILRLKAKAQAALGARFDPRAFHAQVLMTGALPMPVLERKLDDWIETQRRGGA